MQLGAINQGHEGASRLLTVSEVGCSAALSAAIYPIPKLTVQVRLSSLLLGTWPPLAKQPDKILVGLLGSVASTDFASTICEEFGAGHIIRVPVGWDLIRPAGKSDPFTWFVNTAVARTNDRHHARSIAHDGNHARWQGATQAGSQAGSHRNERPRG